MLLQSCSEKLSDWLQENILTIVSMAVGLVLIQVMKLEMKQQPLLGDKRPKEYPHLFKDCFISTRSVKVSFCVPLHRLSTSPLSCYCTRRLEEDLL